MKYQVLLASMMFASSAFASPQIGHIFAPNTSQSFSAAGRVSQNLSLSDAKGKPVTLTTSNQLVPQGVDVNSLAPADQNALRVTAVKVGYDDKAKVSFVSLNSGKSDRIDQQSVRLYLPLKLQMDGSMMIKNFDNAQSDASQSRQNVALSLVRTPGTPNHVDDFDPHVSCTITRQVPDGEDCHMVVGMNGELFCSRLPAQADFRGPRGDGQDHDGGGNHQGQPGQAGPGAQTPLQPAQPGNQPGNDKPQPPASHQVCEPRFRTIIIDGTQACRTHGDTWTDAYTLSIGSAAQYQWGQDYSTVTTDCSPCHPNHGDWR